MTAFLDIFLSLFGFLNNSIVFKAISLASEQRNPTSEVTISFCPPFPITIGTAPADIASTVVMPKCSAFSGSLVSSIPKPVACQKNFALEYSCCNSLKLGLGMISTGSLLAFSLRSSNICWFPLCPPAKIKRKPSTLEENSSKASMSTSWRFK